MFTRHGRKWSTFSHQWRNSVMFLITLIEPGNFRLERKRTTAGTCQRPQMAQLVCALDFSLWTSFSGSKSSEAGHSLVYSLSFHIQRQVVPFFKRPIREIHRIFDSRRNADIWTRGFPSQLSSSKLNFTIIGELRSWILSNMVSSS